MDEVKDKKPVGRPKKKTVVITNEEAEKITMKQKEVDKATVQNDVGNVKDTPGTITVQDIRARWQEVFHRFGNLGLDSITTAWGNSKSMLNNPFIQNARVKQINSPAGKLTKAELAESMSDPESHEDNLRSVSWGLYYSNYIYQTLLQLNRNTPKYLYYATPLYIEDAKKEEVKTDSIKVNKILRKFNPKLTFKTIAGQVAVEGKCSYLVRTSHNKKDVDFLVLQKLNSDQVKITGFGSKQQFIASFNMIVFLQPGYSVEQYPKFIQDAWAEMNALGIITEDKRGVKKLNPKAQIPMGHILETLGDGTYMYWIQIPQDLCYTFYSDGSHPNAFPDEIGLFTDLNDLGDYRWLQGNLLSKGVNSVLTAEIPIIKDPKPGSDSTVISPDTILGYSDFFAQNVSENIFPFFAPFTDFKLHSMENQPESMNIIYSRIRDLIATSGQSALLPITDKPSIASVKTAQALQASKNDYLTRQFESFLNNVINDNFDLKCEWNIVVHGNIFSALDEEVKTKELVKDGYIGLLPRLLSYEGLTVEDYAGSKNYLEILGIEVPVAEAQKEEEKLPEGRPPIPENDIDNDNTGTSRDAGNNVSEIK